MREILHLRIDRLDTPIGELLLRLDDSIKPWIPELANRRVLKSISSDLDDTVPALRPITLRDLLTY